MIIVQDLMSGIETVSSGCGWRTAESQREKLEGLRTEVLSDLQCHCLNAQKRMVEVGGKGIE